jgi:hypothetical protein
MNFDIVFWLIGTDIEHLVSKLDAVPFRSVNHKESQQGIVGLAFDVPREKELETFEICMESILKFVNCHREGLKELALENGVFEAYFDIGHFA